MAAKKYYWLKLKEDFFEDDTIAWIEEQDNGAEYALFYLKLCLKSLKNDGVLIRNVGDMLIPYDIKKLAEITRTDADTVRVAMEMFQAVGLVQILENGEIYLSQLENMVGAETRWAEQKRLQRAKKTELLPAETLENEPLEGEVDNVLNLSSKSPVQCPTEIESRDRDRDRDRDKEIDEELELVKDKEKENNNTRNIKPQDSGRRAMHPAQVKKMISDYPKDFQTAFMEWEKMRKIIRKPITGEETVRRTLKKLNDFTAHIEDEGKRYEEQIKILNQSTDNNWQGVFPLREPRKPKKGPKDEPKEKKYDFHP